MKNKPEQNVKPEIIEDIKTGVMKAERPKEEKMETDEKPSMESEIFSCFNIKERSSLGFELVFFLNFPKSWSNFFCSNLIKLS